MGVGRVFLLSLLKVEGNVQLREHVHYLLPLLLAGHPQLGDEHAKGDHGGKEDLALDALNEKVNDVLSDDAMAPGLEKLINGHLHCVDNARALDEGFVKFGSRSGGQEQGINELIYFGLFLLRKGLKDGLG